MKHLRPLCTRRRFTLTLLNTLLLTLPLFLLRRAPHIRPYPPPLPRIRSSNTHLPFTHPQIHTLYRRKLTPTTHRLHIYTSGISIGGYFRNFHILACVIGTSAYPVYATDFDITQCTIPNTATGPVSLLVQNDTVLHKAISGTTVTLDGGLQVTLPPHTFVPPPTLDVSALGALRPLAEGAMLLRGPLLASAPLESVHADMPRYEVCVVTQVKPFARLLPAWVEYHARLGVDHFYILDNGAPDDIGAILGERRNVEIVEWLWEKTQVQALSYVLHAARGRCEWLMAIDVDEYVLVGGVGTGDARADERLLKRYVRMRAHAVEITLHYVTMASRIPARTSDNPAKDYTFLAERQVRGKGKSLCKTEYEWLRAGVHFCAPVREMMADCKKRRVDVVGMEPRRVEDAGVVVHFKYRSAEEMKEKVRVGSGSTADVKNLVREVGKVPKVRRVGREWSFFKEFYARVVAGGVGGVCVKWVNGGKVESFYAKG